MTRRWRFKRKMWVWKLRTDAVRLRLAFRILPERFRAESAGLWKALIEKDTAQIEDSTREINELTAEIERQP